MIDLAVQEFHTNGYAMVFADFLYAIEADDGVLGAFCIGHAFAVAGERDYVDHPGLGRQRDVLAKAFFNTRVIFDAVHGALDRAAVGVPHGADQAVLGRRVPLVGIQQVDCLAADFGRVGAKLVERNVFVAPARNRLLDVALALDRSALLRPSRRWNRSHGDSRNGRLNEVASRYGSHSGQSVQKNFESGYSIRACKLRFAVHGLRNALCTLPIAVPTDDSSSTHTPPPPTLARA